MPFDLFKSIEVSLGINRRATQIAMGGFIVMALAIGLLQFLDDDRLTFWHLLAGLVALMVFMLVITSLPLLARRVLAWVLTICLSFIAVTATAQAITKNGITGLAPAHCILSYFMSQTCEVSPALINASTFALIGAAWAQASATDPQPLTGDALGTAKTGASVFIQFAGYRRDSVVTLAEALSRDGWPVEDPGRGGERIVTAAGLNEVRYFFTDDGATAAALAAAVTPLVGGQPIALRDLSQTQYGKSAPGHLEVWISE